MIPWSPDTFANGGILVDQDKLWAMRDKVQHLLAWFILARVELHWLHLGWLSVLGLGLTTGILWELFEWWNYRKWTQRGQPQPWPACTDLPSWRDLVANMIGTALAVWVL